MKTKPPATHPLTLRPWEVRCVLAGTKTVHRSPKGLEDVTAYRGQIEGQGVLGPLGYQGLEKSDRYRKDKRFFREQPGRCHWFLGQVPGEIHPIPVVCPWEAGGGAWVREVWAIAGNEDGHPIDAKGQLCQEREAQIVYRADATQCDYGLWLLPDGREFSGRWRSPVTMPRRASRIAIPILSIGAERVQSITEEDARAEGFASRPVVAPTDLRNAWQKFAAAWDTQHGPGSWDRNGWVWRVEWAMVRGGRR